MRKGDKDPDTRYKNKIYKDPDARYNEDTKIRMLDIRKIQRSGCQISERYNDADTRYKKDTKIPIPDKG